MDDRQGIVDQRGQPSGGLGWDVAEDPRGAPRVARQNNLLGFHGTHAALDRPSATGRSEPQSRAVRANRPGMRVVERIGEHLHSLAERAGGARRAPVPARESRQQASPDPEIPKEPRRGQTDDHVGGIGRVESPVERSRQPLVRLPAELAGEERGHRLVQARPGRERLQPQTKLSAPGQGVAPKERAEREGHFPQGALRVDE